MFNLETWEHGNFHKAFHSRKHFCTTKEICFYFATARFSNQLFLADGNCHYGRLELTNFPAASARDVISKPKLISDMH